MKYKKQMCKWSENMMLQGRIWFTHAAWPHQCIFYNIVYDRWLTIRHINGYYMNKGFSDKKVCVTFILPSWYQLIVFVEEVFKGCTVFPSYANKASEGPGEEVVLHSCILFHSLISEIIAIFGQLYWACFPIWGHCFCVLLSLSWLCLIFVADPFALSWFPPFSFLNWAWPRLTSASQWSPSYPCVARSNPLRCLLSSRGDYPPQAESSSTAPLSSAGTVRNIPVDGTCFYYSTFLIFNDFL